MFQFRADGSGVLVQVLAGVEFHGADFFKFIVVLIYQQGVFHHHGEMKDSADGMLLLDFFEQLLDIGLARHIKCADGCGYTVFHPSLHAIFLIVILDAGSAGQHHIPRTPAYQPFRQFQSETAQSARDYVALIRIAPKLGLRQYGFRFGFVNVT